MDFTGQLICKAKALYAHSSYTSGFQNWSEFENPTAEEQRINNLGKEYAVIHKYKRIQTGTVFSWVTDSIEAQSPRLRRQLDLIFSDYPEWYADSSPYSVSPPFKPYIHRWEKISDADKDLQCKAFPELQVLRHELEPCLKQHLESLERLKRTGVVLFEDIWLIFAPGCLMVSREGDQNCVSTLRSISLIPEKRNYPEHWRLTLNQIDWNGSYTGIKTVIKNIPKYEEPLAVLKLEIHPLEFEPNQESIRAEVLSRGRQFEELRGFHVAVCRGSKYTFQQNQYSGEWKETKKNVSGRVIIDTYAYFDCQDEQPPKPSLKNLSHVEEPEEQESDSDSESGSVKDDTKKPTERKEDMRPLSDLECIIAVPRVRGLDLNTKEWCEFDVSDIHDVEWSETPYNNLVLPKGDKELVMSFASCLQNDHDRFDDFVEHKGEGVIILLSGPPGVGKTLTAEAVADMSKAPLFILSASDLGTSPDKVDKALTKALECCRLWHAVLLLDEADVFLERRDSNSLARNELVSIFLRRLEYYRGLMFLTTNRVSNIDPAFKSRIDLTIPYRHLDEAARQSLWKNFVQRLEPGAANISDDDYVILAKTNMNGREVKNAIKTALVLSKHQKVPLSVEHLQIVLDVRKRVAESEVDDSRPGKRKRQDD